MHLDRGVSGGLWVHGSVRLWKALGQAIFWEGSLYGSGCVRGSGGLLRLYRTTLGRVSRSYTRACVWVGVLWGFWWLCGGLSGSGWSLAVWLWVWLSGWLWRSVVVALDLDLGLGLAVVLWLWQG